MDDRTDIARRMETIGLLAAKQGAVDTESALAGLERDPWQPRWKIDTKWIEFECGCRAERCMKLFGAAQWDPVIFRRTNQQAVYDFACGRHLAGMNKIVHFGGFADFGQWKLARRAQLMGKVRA